VAGAVACKASLQTVLARPRCSRLGAAPRRGFDPSHPNPWAIPEKLLSATENHGPLCGFWATFVPGWSVFFFNVARSLYS
jgi:hypothetical protein